MGRHFILCYINNPYLAERFKPHYCLRYSSSLLICRCYWLKVHTIPIEIVGPSLCTVCTHAHSVILPNHICATLIFAETALRRQPLKGGGDEAGFCNNSVTRLITIDCTVFESFIFRTNSEISNLCIWKFWDGDEDLFKRHSLNIHWKIAQWLNDKVFALSNENWLLLCRAYPFVIFGCKLQILKNYFSVLSAENTESRNCPMSASHLRRANACQSLVLNKCNLLNLFLSIWRLTCL